MNLHFSTMRRCWILFLIVGIQTMTYAQVTIGADLPANPGSLLDVKESNNPISSTKGLMSARVALEKFDILDPCVKQSDLQPGDDKAHIGLVVYNVTDDLSVGLCPGLHVWDGERWIRLPEPCTFDIDPELLNSPNCYIVPPGTNTSEEIPIGKAFMVHAAYPELEDLSITDKLSLDIIWQDKQNLVGSANFVDGYKGIYSRFTVTTNSGEGNAVVALRVGPKGNEEDPIRWSWHIWVTNYNPDTNSNGTTYEHINGGLRYIFMDRNIGSLSTSQTNDNSMGLLYQWGRKDPFVSASGFFDGYTAKTIYSKNGTILTEGADGTGIKYELATSENNMQNSILRPLSYFYGPESSTGAPFDWMTSSESGVTDYKDLWGGVYQEKSPFDPCPKGWKVPPHSNNGRSPWKNYEAYQSGWDYIVPSEAVFGDNGVNLINRDLNGELGFYPYGKFRRDRDILEPCGNGGSGNSRVTSGGDFYGKCMSNVDARFVLYWSATQGDSPLTGKAEYMQRQGDHMGPAERDFKNMSMGKAIGAYVRCVQVYDYAD